MLECCRVLLITEKGTFVRTLTLVKLAVNWRVMMPEHFDEQKRFGMGKAVIVLQRSAMELEQKQRAMDITSSYAGWTEHRMGK